MVFDMVVGDVREDQIVVFIGIQEGCDIFHPCCHRIRIHAFLESFLYIGTGGISEAFHDGSGSGYPIGFPIGIVSDDIPADISVLCNNKAPGFNDPRTVFIRILAGFLDKRSGIVEKRYDLEPARSYGSRITFIRCLKRA